MRRWLVGGALIRHGDGLVLVGNRRRDQSLEWTPPGGVIDQGETILSGLTREVKEETGLSVVSWAGRRYTVTTTGLTLDGRHAPGAEPWTNPLGGRLLPDPPTNVRNGRKRRRTRKPVPTTPRKPRPTLRP